MKIFCDICRKITDRDWKSMEQEIPCQFCDAPIENLVVWGKQ